MPSSCMTNGTGGPERMTSKDCWSCTFRTPRWKARWCHASWIKPAACSTAMTSCAPSSSGAPRAGLTTWCGGIAPASSCSTSEPLSGSTLGRLPSGNRSTWSKSWNWLDRASLTHASTGAGTAHPFSSRTAERSLAGRPVALASSGEALELPCVHARQPILAVRGRWADPRVAGNMGVTQGVHVRPILVDPCVYLISSADGPVAGDEDIDVARHALEQPQRGEVVLDRVSGVVQVEQRNQDIRKHVAGDENPAFLNEQRRMARGMRLVLDNPDLRAIPRNLRHLGGQAGNEAEQVQRYLLGDAGGLRTPVRQPISGSGRAARRARTGRRLGAWRARAGDPNEDASRSLPQRSGPNRTGRSRGRPFRSRAPRGR